MKRFFVRTILISSFIFGLNPGFCAEQLSINLGKDYILTTEKTVYAAASANPAVVMVSPFFTIFNEKNVILIHPIKVGKANFTIFLDNSSTVFETTVNPSGTNSPLNYKKGDFEIILLDEPPVVEDFEIEAPPVIKQEKI